MLHTTYMRVISCLALSVFALCAAADNAKNYLLNTPADISHRAQNSVMLGVDSAGTRIVTVGERGFILYSDDQGKTWEQAKVPVSVTLTAIDFVTPQKGWVVGHGGVVLRTHDSGATWHKVLDGIQAAKLELNAAEASFDANNRRSKLRLREAKYGVEAGADKPFLNVHFSDDNNGIVVGAYGYAFITEDGGDSWQSMMGEIPNTFGMHLYDIHQREQALFLIGEQGSLFKRVDDEAVFKRIDTPYEGSFFGMAESDQGDLLLFGLRGHLFRSTDVGETWQQIPLPLPVTLTDAHRLIDGGIVLLDEAGQVFISRDAGRSFMPVTVEAPAAFTQMVETAKGDLVLSSARGISHIPAHDLSAEVVGNE